MDPEKIMNGISKELLASLEAMEKAKTPEEKVMHSKTVRNLTQSLGVFLNLMNTMDMIDDDDDDAPTPF